MDLAILGSAPPEKQLLVCCARTSTDSDVATRILELASASTDCDSLLAQAAEHSLIPLLARNLLAAAGDTVPQKYAADLRAAQRANAIRCLAQISELVRIVSALESAGIPALPYKGPVIAAQAYRDITARQFQDLDIILLQRDIPRADDVVRGLGYAPRWPWVHSPNAKGVTPGEYNYFNEARQTMLELHTEATFRHFPVPPPLTDFFSRAVPVDLGGQSISTFCPEDALSVYCVHGTKDFWSKLIWVADIAELLRAAPGLDWDAAVRTARQIRAERMLNLGVALAVGMLGATVPPQVLARVKADRGVPELAADIAARFAARDAPEWTARERFHFRRQSVKGLAAGGRYAVRLTLAPAEEDWQGAQQARPASPFYALVRPFRLLRKYGSAGKQ
jgi:hypothetical protein